MEPGYGREEFIGRKESKSIRIGAEVAEALMPPAMSGKLIKTGNGGSSGQMEPGSGKAPLF